MPTWMKASSAVVFIALVVYIVFVFIRPSPDECALLAKQQSATVDVQATVSDLDLLKGKIGVTAGQVQEVDAILKDYALKYETACRDHRAKTIGDAEYNCRRDNMDQALNAARGLALTLQEVKGIADPAAQRDIILKDIDAIRQAADGQFSHGCGSALAVTPTALSFQDHFPELTIQVTNTGNRNSSYYVAELPEAFAAVIPSGQLAVGQSVVVSIKRAALPVASGSPLVFYVGDNFNQRVPVNITVDADNAQLYGRLSKTLSGTPTVDDAIRVVAKELPAVKDEASRYFFAAGILMQAEQFSAAKQAVEHVAQADHFLYDAHATQLLAGLVDVQLKNQDGALAHFAAAGQSPAGGKDIRAAATSKLLSGSVMLAEGHNVDAGSLLADPDVRRTIIRDPELRQYVERSMNVSNLVEAAKATVPAK